MSNLLAKLGTSGRTEAAAMAARIDERSRREVAGVLRDKDVGVLLVRDADGFGILSERDVVCALAET